MSVRAAGRELLRQQVFNPNRAKRPSSRGAPMFLQTAINASRVRASKRVEQRDSTVNPTASYRNHHHQLGPHSIMPWLFLITHELCPHDAVSVDVKATELVGCPLDGTRDK